MPRSGSRLVLLIAAAVAALFAEPALAQHPAPPGQFDYYLLTLSWSPTFCAAHRHDQSAKAECASHRGFVLHGLWPQFADDSWPEFCRAVPPVPATVVQHQSGIMPNAGLVEHEWERHGSCTTFDANDYFAAADRLFAGFVIPAEWRHADRAIDMQAGAVESRFDAANPGLAPGMMALTCRRGSDEVEEIRVCLDKSMRFRHCGPKVMTTCRGNAHFPAAAE